VVGGVDRMVGGVDRVVGGVDRVVGGVEIEYVEVIKENAIAHRPVSFNALAHRSLAQVVGELVVVSGLGALVSAASIFDGGFSNTSHR
jgi:hypothetical protein